MVDRRCWDRGRLWEPWGMHKHTRPVATTSGFRVDWDAAPTNRVCPHTSLVWETQPYLKVSNYHLERKNYSWETSLVCNGNIYMKEIIKITFSTNKLCIVGNTDLFEWNILLLHGISNLCEHVISVSGKSYISTGNNSCF